MFFKDPTQRQTFHYVSTRGIIPFSSNYFVQIFMYADFFSEEKILPLLCKYRIRVADHRHKAVMQHKISSHEDVKKRLQAPDPKGEREKLLSILPPRSMWIRPGEGKRKISDSKNVAAQSILNYIHKVQECEAVGNDCLPDWYVELRQFIDEVADLGINPDPSKPFTPSITYEPKVDLKSKTERRKKKKRPKATGDETNQSKPKTLRPIACYPLQQRIIISLTASYLTSLFNDSFLDSSFAFRIKKQGEKRVVSHHDAVVKILDFRKRNSPKPIWVAECDIKKFFDCVNHDVVWECFNALKKSTGIFVDPRAEVILDQYLSSYSFPRNVLPLNETLPPFLGKYEWPKTEEFESIYPGLNPLLLPLGIPQGGALSCFIANLLLHTVDLRLESYNSAGFLYLRFCDDMIILSVKKSECDEASNLYHDTTKHLKLLTHQPKKIEQYNREFWEGKSKSPYLWAPKHGKEGKVPWVSFVGYQVRFDGELRARKSSIEKEKRKIARYGAAVLKSLGYIKDNPEAMNEHSKLPKRRQYHALHMRYISMSVGKKKLYSPTKLGTLCWSSGYRLLNTYGGDIAKRQMKELDRCRTRVLKKIKFKLEHLKIENAGKRKKGEPDFYGQPFSYHSIIRSTTEPMSDKSGDTVMTPLRGFNQPPLH
ncbi:MAG: reverse transcriptase domain-containing protein [Candidatus Kapaibacterium sp.]